MNYDGYVRLIDPHGVLHLAHVEAPIGTGVLCGWPPEGNQLGDAADMTTYLPRELTRSYKRVCPTCNVRS